MDNANQAQRKARLLVVEDEVNLLESIRTVLELDGYEVVTAENGAQALAQLRSGHPLPELIVSDIMMPVMSGIELLKEVRKNPDWIAIPFIFLTARSEKADVQRSKLLGVDDYLIKPFDVSDLLIAIEARLNRIRAINSAVNSAMVDLKQRILTILHHEFRTPLTFIVAYADMLNNADTHALSSEEMLTFLKGVNTGAARLRRLIENFIQLVEMETGDARRNYQARRTVIEDLPKLIQEAAREVFTPEVKHTLTMDVEGKLPAFLGDPDYLRSAVIHLLDNAIKFSPEAPLVTVGARAAQLPRRGALGVEIWVRDFGRGIAPAELNRIWESFYQIDRAAFEDQGTGTGLAIVRAVAELHGGEVGVQSAPGAGSTFSLFLPLEPE
jgi:two-component system sensor histidine kinase/response regulator